MYNNQQFDDVKEEIEEAEQTNEATKENKESPSKQSVEKEEDNLGVELPPPYTNSSRNNDDHDGVYL